MSGFDTLELAENVANFPIPIITGIGHERDESILDMVSHTRMKTPTAVAAFLISHLKDVLDALNEAQNRIVLCTESRLSNLKSQLSAVSETIPRLFPVIKARQETRIDALSHRLSNSIQRRILENQNRLSTYEQRLPMMMERRLTQERHQLEMIGEKMKMLDPTLLLRRGYSITLKDGKSVKDPATLKAGDEIETRLEKGTIKSVVKK